jgi:hypothetical protein
MREILRSMVANVVFQDARRTSAPKTYCNCASAVRVCRFGETCKRTDVFHWMESDHPSTHPLYGTPTPPPEVFQLDGLRDCHHWCYKGFCAVGDDCRFAHHSGRRGVRKKRRGRGRGSEGGIRLLFFVSHALAAWHCLLAPFNTHPTTQPPAP